MSLFIIPSQSIFDKILRNLWQRCLEKPLLCLGMSEIPLNAANVPVPMSQRGKLVFNFLVMILNSVGNASQINESSLVSFYAKLPPVALNVHS